jgi:PAS domain S-box-containing protein
MPKDLTKHRRVLFFASSGGLVVYLAVLILSNYYFQARFAKSQHEQYKMQSLIAVGVVQSYFDARRFEMGDLLTSREVAAYFENKALGMSQQYGLKQSLAIVHARFLAVMGRKQATGGAPYRRIVLYDEHGEVLTDSPAETSEAGSPAGKNGGILSLPADGAQKIICRSRDEILLVTPYEVNGQVHGTIVAWLNVSTAGMLISDQMRASGIGWKLMAENPAGYQAFEPVSEGDGNAAGAALQTGPPLAARPGGKGWNDGPNASPMTILRLPIPGTPFVLESMIPSGGMGGWNFPTVSLFGLVALSAAVLLALLLFLRVNEESIAMTVRVQETERTSEQMSQKNARLQEEIEQRMEAEQKLAGSEKLLTSVITGAQVGIWDWNIQTGKTILNERWAEIIGCHLGDLEPFSAADWARLCHPEDLERSSRLFERVFDGTLNHYECELRVRHALGHWVWVLDRGMVIERDGDGKPLHASGTRLDISERKQAEEELRRLNATLEQRVEEQVAKNMEQERALIHQSRLAAMGEMVGNIAHQWRQPLNALGLLFVNVKDAYGQNTLDEPFLQQSTETAMRLTQKMSTTINDFRNFFHPHKEPMHFSAREQVEAAVALVEESFKSNGIAIRTDLAQDSSLYGFPNEYSQVLLNLFCNARDSIAACGARDGVIDVRLAQEDAFCSVYVADNGGGIPSGTMDKIFEPYFSTKPMGTGIGLYMSSMIIERNMHGRITARNLDGGAEFKVVLPRAATPD